MDRKYRRLTITDRTLIGHLKVKGLNQTQIAKLLGFNRSTICRELKRNHDPDFGYNILIAHERTQRRQWIHHRTKIQRHSPLQQHILERLKEGWSPGQIAGRSKLDLGKTWVSHETIYKYIYSKDGIKDELYKYLRDKRKRRYPKIGRRPNKRSLIPNRVLIHERPDSINKRLDFGHWEADLIVFSQDKKANLLTLRERKSRYMIAIKNDNRCPDTIVSNLFEKYRLRWRPPFHSITFDNDISFIQHEKISNAFNSKTYFCEPYKSYQKGTIENGNRLLREYLPRKTDILAINQTEIDRYVGLINNRPMKCLGYKTPDKVYRQFTFSLLR